MKFKLGEELQVDCQTAQAMDMEQFDLNSSVEMDQSNEEMELPNEEMGSSLEEIGLSTLRKDVDARAL